ncbi:MAG: membrane-binding protein [Bacteroidota bacterium]
MKSHISFLFLLCVLIVSCSDQQKENTDQLPPSLEMVEEIPDRFVNRSLLNYDNKISLWYLDHELYSGYAVSYHPDSTLKEKIGILKGRKQHQAISWYANGILKQLANYHKGKLHGEKKLWLSDSSHTLVTHLNYHSGKAHGEQKQWYPTGEPYKILNLNMGKEEGMQRAFRKNGGLYANYELRNGRIFGLKKAALCYGLEDENINYEK